jgi:large subunit ribosomal protein L18
MLSPKHQSRHDRKRRISARIRAVSSRPRLTVYRSLTQVMAQVVDDATGKTLAAVSTKELKSKPNIEGARKAGELLAKKAKDAGVTKVTFDRAGYKYHGRIKALADGAREGGLQF